MIVSRIDKLRAACADPDGPLYGSDLVPIISDLMDDFQTLTDGVRAARAIFDAGEDDEMYAMFYQAEAVAAKYEGSDQ